MPIRFHCPKCHIRLSVAERKAGHSSPCPNCRQVITIPAEGPPPLPATTLETSSALATAEKSEPPSGTSHARPPTSDASEFVDPPVAQSQAVGASQQSPASNETWQTETAIYDVPPRPALPSQLASDGTTTALPNTISLPRWTVYFQGGLLAVVATTFFLLGMMLGQNSSGTAERSSETYDCQLTGRVVFNRGATKAPDEGAVVIVVPKDGSLQDRVQDHAGLRPEEFEAIDNPSIAQIEAAGGRVVRINHEGEFDLPLRGPREYYVLIISRHSERAAEVEISTSTRAELSGYFFAPDVIGPKKYYLTTLVLNRRSQNLPTVEF